MLRLEHHDLLRSPQSEHGCTNANSSCLVSFPGITRLTYENRFVYPNDVIHGLTLMKRDIQGKFALKNDAHRSVRSLRLTDRRRSVSGSAQLGKHWVLLLNHWALPRRICLNR